MTFDDFQATIRARFPGVEFEFREARRLINVSFFARHERCTIELFQWNHEQSLEWSFDVGHCIADTGSTLAAAIDAHQRRLQLISTNAQAMGLL